MSGKPSFQSVWNALRKWCKKREDKQDRKFAMPKIAWGVNDIWWEIVIDKIEFLFYNSKIESDTKWKEGFYNEWDRNMIKRTQSQDGFCKTIKD